MGPTDFNAYYERIKRHSTFESLKVPACALEAFRRGAFCATEKTTSGMDTYLFNVPADDDIRSSITEALRLTPDISRIMSSKEYAEEQRLITDIIARAVGLSKKCLEEDVGHTYAVLIKQSEIKWDNTSRPKVIKDSLPKIYLIRQPMAHPVTKTWISKWNDRTVPVPEVIKQYKDQCLLCKYVSRESLIKTSYKVGYGELEAKDMSRTHY